MARSNNVRTKYHQDKEKLRVYLEEKERAGLGVPQDWKREGYISTQTISAETGIPLRVLHNGGLRPYIQEWVKRIGYSNPIPLPPSIPGPASNHERSRRYLLNLEAYFLKLKRENRKIPENPYVRGKPHWLRISAESGVPAQTFIPRTRVGRRLSEAVAEIGMELQLDGGRWDVLTYGVLVERGCELRKGELKGRPNAGAQLSNTKTALVSQFMLHFEKSPGVPLTVDDLVGDEFNEDFEQAVRAVKAKIENLGTRRKFGTEIERWKKYYRMIFQSMALPSKFREALEVLVTRTGVSVKRLAELADGNPQTIMTWLEGRGSPCPLSYEYIERIEAVLGVAPKTLISLINDRRTKRFRMEDYPEYVTVDGEQVAVRSDRPLQAELRPLLPNDFNEYTSEKQEEVVAYLIENLINPSTVWSKLNKAFSSTPYRAKTLPPVFNGELIDYTKFRRDRKTPSGMVRKARWAKATAVLFENHLKYIVGTLTNERDTEDRMAMGLGLDENNLSFAMFLNTAIVNKYVEMKGERRFENWNNVFPGVRKPNWEDDQREIYTDVDVSVIRDIGCLFAPEYGWLRQRPDLADNLKPIPGFIDKKFVKTARQNWPALCDAAYDAYFKLAKEIKGLAEKLRDPFEPIAPILDLPNPMSAFTLLSRNILDDKPDPSTAPVMAAWHSRDYLISRVLSETAFRSKQMRELTCTKDDTGHLRRENGKYVIEIPYKMFKNWDSLFFGREGMKHDYRKELADTDGLYDKIEEYRQVHRPVLLRGNQSDIFFISNHRTILFTPQSFHKNYQRLTTRYVAYNPYLNRGIPGVKPHGPHTVRDIIATHVLKRTGSYTLAAYAIHATEEMVSKHYGRLFPADKLMMVEQILREALDNG
jgi:hypothetical protein